MRASLASKSEPSIIRYSVNKMLAARPASAQSMAPACARPKIRAVSRRQPRASRRRRSQSGLVGGGSAAEAFSGKALIQIQVVESGPLGTRFYTILGPWQPFKTVVPGAAASRALLTCQVARYFSILATVLS